MELYPFGMELYFLRDGVIFPSEMELFLFTINDLLFTIYFMSFVTARLSSNEFGSALAAPKFSYLFVYLDILSFWLFYWSFGF